MATRKKARRRKEQPSRLLKSAEKPLDGAAALLKLAAARLNAASAYASDGAPGTAAVRFYEAVDLTVQALVTLRRIAREHGL